MRRIFLSQESSFHQFPHAYKHTPRLLLYLPLFIDSYNCALYLVDQPLVLWFLASSKRRERIHSSSCPGPLPSLMSSLSISETFEFECLFSNCLSLTKLVYLGSSMRPLRTVLAPSTVPYALRELTTSKRALHTISGLKSSVYKDSAFMNTTAALINLARRNRISLKSAPVYMPNLPWFSSCTRQLPRN